MAKKPSPQTPGGKGKGGGGPPLSKAGGGWVGHAPAHHHPHHTHRHHHHHHKPGGGPMTPGGPGGPPLAKAGGGWVGHAPQHKKAKKHPKRKLAGTPLAGGWILGGNDTADNCAAVAVANALLEVTGHRMSDAELLGLHDRAGPLSIAEALAALGAQRSTELALDEHLALLCDVQRVGASHAAPVLDEPGLHGAIHGLIAEFGAAVRADGPGNGELGASGVFCDVLDCGSHVRPDALHVRPLRSSDVEVPTRECHKSRRSSRDFYVTELQPQPGDAVPWPVVAGLATPHGPHAGLLLPGGALVTWGGEMALPGDWDIEEAWAVTR